MKRGSWKLIRESFLMFFVFLLIFLIYVDTRSHGRIFEIKEIKYFRLALFVLYLLVAFMFNYYWSTKFEEYVPKKDKHAKDLYSAEKTFKEIGGLSNLSLRRFLYLFKLLKSKNQKIRFLAKMNIISFLITALGLIFFLIWGVIA